MQVDRLKLVGLKKLLVDRYASALSLQPKPLISSHSGFTLVEMIITIVLISIIAGLAAVIILQGARAYSDEDYRSNVHYQVRLAVERIAREARQIQECSAITTAQADTFSFLDETGATVTFTVSGGNLLRDGNLLASGITSAQPFSFYDADGATSTACPGIWFIDINITGTQGSQSLQMRSRVHPRSFN